MRRVFKVFLCLALVMALMVPFSIIGASTVKAEGEIYINETNFPDENFRNFLLSNTTYTTSGESKYYTQAQLAKVTNIDCFRKNISSLKGIEFFTKLTVLDCSNNNLTSLDVSKNGRVQLLT